MQNHSCDPNCVIEAVYIHEANVAKPLVTIFTCKDVLAGEELTFSYAGPDDEEVVKETAQQVCLLFALIPFVCEDDELTGDFLLSLLLWLLLCGCPHRKRMIMCMPNAIVVQSIVVACSSNDVFDPQLLHALSMLALRLLSYSACT